MLLSLRPLCHCHFVCTLMFCLWKFVIFRWDLFLGVEYWC